MKYISATYLRNNVAEVLDEVRFNRIVIVIQRHGRSVAKLVPIDADNKTGKKEASGKIPKGH